MASADLRRTKEEARLGPPQHPGVIEVGDWAGHRSRTALWSTWDDGKVQVDGRQYADGQADAAVSVYADDGEQFDAAQARKLAAALLDAADLLDGLR